MSVTARVVDCATVSPDDEAGDTVSVRRIVGPQTGFAALEQNLYECAPGLSEPRRADDAETVLFVLAGSGAMRAAGATHPLEPESGAYLAPGETYQLENPGPEALRIVVVKIPDPEPLDPPGTTGERVAISRLADQAAQAATTDREFRVVADPVTGLRSATHFVGYIPTTRAPEHFHTYDEVIYVIDGEGVLHAEGAQAPLAAGSCIQLPARTVHGLENTGADVMRVVAVFRPAGSPAAAYYPDGTPAYAEPSMPAQAS